MIASSLQYSVIEECLAYGTLRAHLMDDRALLGHTTWIHYGTPARCDFVQSCADLQLDDAFILACLVI